MKIPKGIVEDVLVKIDKFYYPVDFVVLDTEPIACEPNHVPIILGRPFLATANAIINCRNGVMQLTFGNMTLELNIFHLNNKHELLENENYITDEVVSKNPRTCLLTGSSFSFPMPILSKADVKMMSAELPLSTTTR